jgi:hypothetical protein
LSEKSFDAVALPSCHRPQLKLPECVQLSRRKPVGFPAASPVTGGQHTILYTGNDACRIHYPENLLPGKGYCAFPYLILNRRVF